MVNRSGDNDADTESSMVRMFSSGTSASVSRIAPVIAGSTLSGAALVRTARLIGIDRQAAPRTGDSCVNGKYSVGTGCVSFMAVIFTSATTPTTTRGTSGKKYSVRCLPTASSFGHGFADQHRAGPSSDVGIIHVASAQKRYMHRAHIPGADEAHIHFGKVGHGRRRPALQGNRLM